MPPVRIELLEHADPSAPYGLKGVGEPPNISTPPAVVAALRAATGEAARADPGAPRAHRLAAPQAQTSAGLVGEHDRLDAVAQAELGQHVGDVGLDRRVAERRARSAISAFDSPRASSRSTSSSRGVSSSSAAGAARRAAPTRANSSIRRRVTVGASSASPAATARIAVDELLGRRVLEQEAARAGLQRVVDVLVEVEGGEDEHARRVARR